MEPSTQPSRRAEGTGRGSSLTSFGRHGTEVSWSACTEGSSQGVTPRTRGLRGGPLGCGSRAIPFEPGVSASEPGGSPNLDDLLPPEVRIFLDGGHELMRKTRGEETRALVEDGGAGTSRNVT